MTNLALSTTCPTCEAPPLTKCVSVQGNPRFYPHATRESAAMNEIFKKGRD